MINEVYINMSFSTICALVLCTNIITEVIKKLFKHLPAEITAFIVSMILTMSEFFANVKANETEIEWCMIIEAVAAGFFVSYGAQFGFDKLKEIINKFKGVK